jgi:UDP-N-acetylglucosamine--N-acetylmuramyl-(pentapeptide) pyrophosphoryl-undecaprenol N-acetylglucosamine transferase
MKVLISGGGTGGHIFPAIAIADALQTLDRTIEILFVGAKGKMEMKKIPESGYKIIGLPIRGFNRKFSFQNFVLPIYILRSLWKAMSILRSFKPDVVVGVGGYASGAILKAASWLRKPIVIQEQNSYPGITNRIMSKDASRIFVAFDGMESYFDKDKIVHSGNPVRQNLSHHIEKKQARMYFGLDPDMKTIGVFGGSLGARSVNDAILSIVDKFKENQIQLIWQTGSIYFNKIQEDLKVKDKHIVILDFIDRMDMAYSACDFVISRAGALTLSELCLRVKPAILVPSPNVVEDHQRKNAEAMLKSNAARMILDSELDKCLWPEIKKLIDDKDLILKLETNLSKLAKPDAAIEIAREIINIAKETKHLTHV